MQKTELQRGMEWVTDTCTRVAADVGMQINEIAWPELREDFDRRVHSLRFSLADRQVIEKFTDENLASVHGDKRTRVSIEARITNLFRSLIAELGVDATDEVEQRPEDEEVERALQYSITSYGADYPVDALVQRIKGDSIFIPSFQRRFVWRKQQASRFVESLLLGLPVPGIFLAKEEDSQRLLVIDGQQRLRTLQYFFDGRFDDTEFALTGVSERFEGLTYRTLLDEDRRRLHDSILHATVVKQDRPQDDDSSIYLVFERLNSGASLLHPQEIRACIFHGPFNDVIANLNQHPSWRAVYGPENPRMKDQELILRFLCLYFDADRYRKPMGSALNRYMKSNRRLQRQSGEEIDRAFVPTIELVAAVLGTNAFRPVRAINAAVFDAVMVGLARRLQRSNIDGEAFRRGYESLLGDKEFQASYERATSDEEQVRKRLDIATTHISRI